MHLRRLRLNPDRYPTMDFYPFNLPLFHSATDLDLQTPVTFFVGENGTGKSTLLEAIAHQCGIHIWRDEDRSVFTYNPYYHRFYDCVEIEWTNGPVPGSFFGSDIFRHFAQLLDDWAASDPGQHKYFGGKSLLTQSHGQSLMSFFKNRYERKGLYLLDEPETALSPKSQLELLRLLVRLSEGDQAQFVIASHSPLLLACPGAVLYSFDGERIRRVEYEETDPYRIYRDFLEDHEKKRNGDEGKNDESGRR